MRKNYAINVNSDFVAFASLEPGDITVIEPDGTESTITLTKSGSDENSPYKARVGTKPAGTRFESEVRMGAWSTTPDHLNIVEGGNFTDVGAGPTGRIDAGLSLVSFQNYYTLIKAVDIGGFESGFVVSGAWTIPGPFGVINLTIGARTINSIEIAWTKPDDNGNAISDYYVEYKVTGEDDYTTVTGLTDDTSYTFRVRAYNGTTGAYSNEAVGETLLDILFFEPDVFKLINIGGATESSVVAFEDGTTITIDGTDYPADAGDRVDFTSTLSQVIEADKPIFAAGRKGNSGASANQKGNMVWSSKDWSGKEFLFTGTRDAPHIITVYAFEDADVTIYQGATPVSGASATLDVDVDPETTFSLPNNGAFRLVSTGLVVAHMHSKVA